MIFGVSGCCDDCSSSSSSAARGMAGAGMGLSWGDLNPLTAAKDVLNSAIDAVGSVAGNVAGTVDKVTKQTLGTALAVGGTVRTLSSPQTPQADIPTTNYLPLALGGGAALLLLAFAARKKKAPTP